MPATHLQVMGMTCVTARYDNSRPWDDVMGINLTCVWWSNQ